MTRLLSSALLAGLLLLSGKAGADQSDSDLPALFTALQDAQSPAQAAPIEAEIWEIWNGHEDQEALKLMRWAGLSLRAGELGIALKYTDEVVTRWPDYAEGWNRRATIYYLLRRYEDSLADIERVLALEPKHFGALSGQGLCHMSLGEYEEALAAFQAALAVNPQMPGPQRNIEALNDILGDPI